MGALLKLFSVYKQELIKLGTFDVESGKIQYEYNLTFGKDSVLDDWLNGKFTKVVVSVDSDEELIALNKALDDTFIPHALITDAGLTEFHGVPTNTCLGIGPYVAEEIDKFTGHLPLL